MSKYEFTLNDSTQVMKHEEYFWYDFIFISKKMNQIKYTHVNYFSKSKSIWNTLHNYINYT